MGKYSFDPDQAVESSKARGSALRAHFKHCREVCHNIKGMKLPKAKAYLCLLYTSPSPRDGLLSRMPSSA